MKERRPAGHQGIEGVDRAGSPPDGRIDVQTLFRAHALFVASFLRRLGIPRSEIDDLVQEVFLVAHRKGGYAPGAGQPRTWLGAIALRVASTSKRTLRRRHEDSNEEAVHAALASDDVARTAETRASLVRVQHALDTLDLEHCAALVLYEFAGESCESIAASLDVPIGTVYSRLHSARRRFIQAYDAFEDVPAAARSRVAGGT
jgi:RNA polymerase sigma-70 factor (ECF subfamily)